MKKEDDIQKEVGFVFHKKVGDKVEKGDVLGYIHSNDEEKAKEVLKSQLYEVK